MTDPASKLAPQIWEVLKQAHKILLTLHSGPDFDSVGSSLAMKHVLEKMGKKVTLISGDDFPPPTCSFLPGFNEIVIKEISQINWEEFDLFLMTDISAPAQVTKKFEIKFPLPIRTVVIDHHVSNLKFADINLVDKDKSSASELVYQVINLNQPELIDQDIALCLYLGMWGDTGGFRFPSTTSETYRIAAKLIDTGIDFSTAVSKAITAPIIHLQLLGYSLYNLKNYFSGKVLVTKIPSTQYDELGFTAENRATAYHVIANEISRCAYYSIAAVIHEKEKGKTGISLRAGNPDDRRDVSVLAIAMGGGGHKYAAATRISGSVEDAEKLLFETIQKIYPELGQP